MNIYQRLVVILVNIIFTIMTLGVYFFYLLYTYNKRKCTEEGEIDCIPEDTMFLETIPKFPLPAVFGVMSVVLPFIWIPIAEHYLPFLMLFGSITLLLAFPMFFAWMYVFILGGVHQ